MDDGSTDSTADLLAEYVKADDRVIHVQHDTNCGLPALRVKACCGRAPTSAGINLTMTIGRIGSSTL